MCLLKVSVVTSLNRSATGKLFHATGPLTAKLLSPQVVVFVEHTAGTRWLIADVNGQVVNLQYSDRRSQSTKALDLCFTATLSPGETVAQSYCKLVKSAESIVIPENSKKKNVDGRWIVYRYAFAMRCG